MECGPIIVVGGFLSRSRGYRNFAGILREVSGAEVYVAPITTVDWVLGRIRGYGQLVFEIATTVDKALLESDLDRAVLVGHSAGGVACRVYLGGDPPYGGRRFSGHRRVSHLITLGSPHVVPDRKGLAPITLVNDLFPGTLHEPTGISYLSVAGSAIHGDSVRWARRRYERFVADGRVAGDGVIPVESALLPGSKHLVLDEINHGRYLGQWYGSDRASVERWWPEELRVDKRLVQERRA